MAIEINLPPISAGAKRIVSLDLTRDLDTSELLTGTPTVTEVTTSDLTIANKAVSTAALEIKGKTVAIGKAVQFSVMGGVSGTTYEIRVSVGTDSTPAETLVYDLMLPCV